MPGGARDLSETGTNNGDTRFLGFLLLVQGLPAQSSQTESKSGFQVEVRNVSIRNVFGNPTWVSLGDVTDLVIAPIVGTGWQIAEDTLDRALIHTIEGLT